MSEAQRDQNFVPSALGVSSSNSLLTLPFTIDSATGRLLTDAAGGAGTVTSVSVVSANGFAGTVANPTTTPAITLSTTITGILKGNGTTISAASAGTDYISPGAITTSGLTMATNKILGRATTGTGAIEEIAVTGSGSVVLATSPTLTTAVLGSSTATTQTPGDNSTKLATTAYVDLAVLGQDFKEAVGAATTANLVGVYLNGSSGVGATFTYTATGVDTLDGITLTLGMRVLLKNQTSSFQNGIYTVTTAGAIGVAGILTRATDANQSFEWKTGDSVFITAGTTLSNTTWAYNGVDSPTMGTDAITFAQVAGQGSFAAGNGITITGNSIAIDTSITVDKTTAQTLTNKTLTSPVLTTPALGTPASGLMTNVTGTATGLTSGITNALKSATTTVDVSAATAPSTGQVLTAIDSTHATWQAASGSSTPTIQFATAFESIGGRYTNTTSGSGSTPSITTTGVNLETGVTSSSYAKLQLLLNSANLFAAGGIFSVIIQTATQAINPSTADSFFGIGNPTVSGSGITFTDRHIGFKIVYSSSVGTVYATVGDGTTETATSLGTVAALDTVDLVLKINSTSSVDFWWRKNGGTQATVNISTNIPTASTATAIQWIVTNKSTAVDNSVSVMASSFQR